MMVPIETQYSAHITCVMTVHLVSKYIVDIPPLFCVHIFLCPQFFISHLCLLILLFVDLPTYIQIPCLIHFKYTHYLPFYYIHHEVVFWLPQCSAWFRRCYGK